MRAGERVLPRRQLIAVAQLSPSRSVAQIDLTAVLGEEIDFDNSRVGTGATLALGAALPLRDHLELRLAGARRWLDVDPAGGGTARLFTARVGRLRASYTFTPRTFARAILQHVETRRDPSLYLDEVSGCDGGLDASLLVGYKLNWQTVLFAGYGDQRELTETARLRPESRELFVKVSYAFQR